MNTTTPPRALHGTATTRLPLSSLARVTRRSHGTLPGRLARACGALALGALAACSSYAPANWPAGTPRSEIVKTLGLPTAQRRPTPEAAPGAVQRLEYARGPMGRHTYMLDFDANDRLLGVQQVLNETRFQQVRPGMTQAALLDLLGRPSDIRAITRQRQKVWSYRYETPFCQWFEVSVSDEGPVSDAGFGPDPLCEKRWD
ncbi:MAG: hypothetical protein V4739_13855 [Pseudomonadota bacterium]